MAEGTQLSNLYKIRFPEHILAAKNAIWAVICKQFLQKFIKKTDLVLDLACGYGEFINNIEAGKKVGVDLNTDSHTFLKPEVEFHECNALNLSTVVRNTADVVFTSNFLEHLPDKASLDTLLDQVLLTLKSGGRFLILGPNLRYLPGQYWDFYDHHLALTHLSLSEALKLKGFTVDVCIDRFLPYTTQGALPTHPAFVWLYLKVPFAWRLLGKQFFIVARKP